MGLTKGNLPRQNTIGGYTFDWDPINNPNDIALTGAYSGAANFYTSFRNSGSSGYVVPVGKTLRIIAAKIINQASGASQFYLCQSDNDCGNTSATVPTNPVWFGTNSSTLTGVTACTLASAGYVGEVGGINFSVAVGKYISGRSSGGATDSACVVLYCKLI